VDKHSRDDEQSVRLCNYVDVYRNDFIAGDLDFMRATATLEELLQFRLKRDDVVITKDSESFSDIGVPALVISEADDLVCGYHLAILRSKTSELSGSYLFRAMQAPSVAHQLHTAAGGVTRFGLSHDDIKSIRVPLPSVQEQSAIAKYLTHANGRIRKAIVAKRNLIALLDERQRLVINQAVTQGLDRSCHRVETGLEWLGEVPEHWVRLRAKNIFRDVDERSDDGLEEVLSVSHLTGVTPRAEKTITMFEAASYAGHKLCAPGDLVINTMWAWMGALGVSNFVGLVSPAYNVYRPKRPDLVDVNYVGHLLRLQPYITMFRMMSTGIRPSRFRFYPDQLLATPMYLPPLDEQKEIVAYIERVNRTSAVAITKANQEISLLREFQTRLTADVVSGRVDVREIAASLPNLDVDRWSILDENIEDTVNVDEALAGDDD
jgi:type I restriction enzyme S subunit